MIKYITLIAIGLSHMILTRNMTQNTNLLFNVCQVIIKLLDLKM